MKNKKSNKKFKVPIILGQTTVTILIPKEHLEDINVSETDFLSCIVDEDNALIIKNIDSVTGDD
jgi:hypothetical protein